MNVVLDRERGMVTPSQSHTHIDVMCYYYVGHSAARLYELPTFICIVYYIDMMNTYLYVCRMVNILFHLRIKQQHPHCL